ncbi:alpha/beta hydrolase, partial [Planktomarina sp.]|nr:alpha/beta hydrolase [Planktomarina sp.]
VTHEQVEGAGHFFEYPHMDPMIETVQTYVKRRLTENTR